MSLMLRGMASAVGQPRSVAAAWLPYARAVLAEEALVAEAEEAARKAARVEAAKKGHFANHPSQSRAIANR